ncbi:MAG TPA: hypothetical protein VGJ27_03380 [Gaiellaceae bacterium]
MTRLRPRSAVGLVALGAFLSTPQASAKDFGPGDLRVCGKARCVAITNKEILPVFSSFYWGPSRLVRAQKVPVGAPAFELRFRNGYVSGTVASARLDRFRAYGFNCSRFQRGKWYRVPARAVRELRRLTASLQPRRVTRTVPPSC